MLTAKERLETAVEEIMDVVNTEHMPKVVVDCTKKIQERR